ncbi:hypothetical protein TTHERM_00194130 (macronuclear) [Tetrahymena thermophila SB210]|uniref:Uncharacterized protein n=1 Tax=Tetrahymena thermophila (strain SB210) TaxID=312017 RepID=Q23KC2_TETTS|nr:hypothetical protein TTHERM_00194130 [Tetrahymena thermophila SB210]EAR96921.1 hypothetical protein TTHERM_00194130 [Tetrahymena thermophila SB210]|eukprot:XP_001017166.1 hypothetical protein TTHERM_00194130 [Tetrahymena thermophila SB210]
MRIQVTKGKIEDALLIFGKDYSEIEEIEEFLTNCECSSFQLEVQQTLEQNQIQIYTVDRKKESKKPKKKTFKNKDFNVYDIVTKYNQNFSIEGELSDDNHLEDGQVNSNKYGEIIDKQIQANLFYFNRQMFNMFSNLDEITQFILNKKVQGTKNVLVLEDIKDIFVSRQIRKEIQMTQNAPKRNLSSDEGEQGLDFEDLFQKRDQNKSIKEKKTGFSTSDDENAPQYQGNKFCSQQNKKKSIQGSDAAIQDWLCEIGIKYDIDYRFTFSPKETNEYLTNCLLTAIKSKYKKDIGLFDQKNKTTSELATAEGLTGYYDQQWVQILMSINQISEKKAVAVAKEYRTITQLIKIYKQQESLKQRELALQSIQYKGEKGKSEKSLGKVISKKIFNIFSNDDPNDLINQ